MLRNAYRVANSCLLRQFSPPCASFPRKLTSEAELVENLFEPKIIPRGTKPLRLDRRKLSRPEADVVISCRRTEFNHYRNKKYQNLDAVPLASKGWNHYKSKGDHFTIQIYNKGDEVKHWSESNFADLNLNENVIEAAKATGVKIPTKIQEKSIPQVLQGKNVLIAAETGCGKTLAYLLPLVQQVLQWKQHASDRPQNSPLALILCPNRELALQIGAVAKSLSHQLPFSSTTLIGGRTKQKMLHPEFHDVDILVATLGAVSKLTTTGIYNVQEIRHLVLDEADTMLDDSFNELLLHFMSKIRFAYANNPKAELPNGCQMTLASATIPTSMYQLLESFIDVQSLEKITSSKLHHVLPHVPQIFYRLGSSEKTAKLIHIAKVAHKEKKPTLVFSNRAPTCDWISLMLHENGVPSTNFNGEMPLVVRSGKYKEFKNGDVMILSATDIASRGLDTSHVRQVVNFDFPLYMADYVHRCGRTGRVGSPKDCRIINFISGSREIDLVNKIEFAVRTMNELPNINGNITKIIKHKIIKNR